MHNESTAPTVSVIAEATKHAHVHEFHHAVAERFSNAAAGTRVFRRTYQIGDGLVCMEFAGDELLTPITRSLEHLRITSNRQPDLTIGLWEVRSGIADLPPPPWDNRAYDKRGEIRGFNNPAFVTVYNPDGRILMVYDVMAGRANVVVFEHARLPAYERAAPLRPVLARFLETRGIQYLHGAAVGLPEGGVLITGKGGAGKSTSALACLSSPLFFAGDDYCAASFRGAPTAYSLYSSAKGHADTIQRLPFLEPLVSNRETMTRDKAIWYLDEHFSAKLIRDFPLRAILLPRVTGKRDTRVLPASPQAALLALAPSTVSQIPNAGTEVFQHLAALTRDLPAYTLELGTELAQIPATILDLLSQHSR